MFGSHFRIGTHDYTSEQVAVLSKISEYLHCCRKIPTL